MKKAKQFSVLVVTNDSSMATVLKSFLENECVQVYRVVTGDEMLQLLTTWKPDIIIMDMVLPDMDGWKVLTRLKTTQDIPIIIVGDNGKGGARVKALKLGADDCFIKPFNCRKIAERIQVILWRKNKEIRPRGIHRAGDLIINSEKIQASYKEHDLELTLTEFRILELLVMHSKQTLNRTDLMEALRGKAFKGKGRVIDTHVTSLRRKLVEKTGIDYIQTVYKVGYRLANETERLDKIYG